MVESYFLCLISCIILYGESYVLAVVFRDNCIGNTSNNKKGNLKPEITLLLMHLKIILINSINNDQLPDFAVVTMTK